MAKKHICEVEGCGKGGKIVRGYCSAHYWRWQKHGDPLGGRDPDGTQLTYLLQALKRETNQCMVWPFRKVRGYGVVWYNGNRWRVHRLAYSLTTGRSIGPSVQIAHEPLTCHNPACFNPRHLREATAAENAADRKIDGTNTTGERNSWSKLTRKQVQQIRGDSRAAPLVASEFGVHKSTIYKIRRGSAWKV